MGLLVQCGAITQAEAVLLEHAGHPTERSGG